jgi:tripartite-type tricarboxylate transporter receptor subunit TctC
VWLPTFSDFQESEMDSMMIALKCCMLLVTALMHVPVLSQTYPDRPIKILVGFPPGGGVDLVARVLSQRLSERFKQQVIVENRSGAGGAIAAEAVTKAAADGLTLLLASPAEVLVAPIVGQKIAYNPKNDLQPIVLVGETPLVIAVHPSVPANNLADLTAFLRSRPGQLSYATPGSGSAMHFAGESFKLATQTFFVHVPYRGATPAVSDLLGKQVEIAIVGMPPVVAHAKAGKLKVLAVTSAKRSPILPDVPTVAETSNMGNYKFTNWMALYAPAKTPAPIADLLAKEVVRILGEPAIRERLVAAGVEPRSLVTNSLMEFLDQERERYQAVAQQRGIRLDD